MRVTLRALFFLATVRHDRLFLVGIIELFPSGCDLSFLRHIHVFSAHNLGHHQHNEISGTIAPEFLPNFGFRREAEGILELLVLVS